MADTYKSRVYTDRPAYADFDAPAKFQAIQSIIARHLKQHPKAICSYSGGADSDILIDVIERTREIFSLPPVKYAFFNTGLEMQATKDHVKATVPPNLPGNSRFGGNTMGKHQIGGMRSMMVPNRKADIRFRKKSYLRNKNTAERGNKNDQRRSNSDS